MVRISKNPILFAKRLMSGRVQYASHRFEGSKALTCCYARQLAKTIPARIYIYSGESDIFADLRIQSC